jgi:hypothetical protein
MSGGRYPYDTTVMVYGAPSPQEPAFPNDSAPLPDARPTLPILRPCAKCKRHILSGTECPFCFREAGLWATDEAVALRAENERLRAENETLRAESARLAKIAEALIDAIGRDAVRAALTALEERYK